jgi:RNA polymerase sigma-70 factor (ECF subfamily)
LEKLETYRGEAPLFTWLCACCRNEIGMHFRRKQRTPALVELDAAGEPAAASPLPAAAPFPDGPESPEGPYGTLARKEEALLVHAALDGLPAHYARALEWKYLDLLPVGEIAARLALGPKAAESLLSRARRAFREGYERLTHGRGSASPEPAICGASGGMP